jgi:hypothetical protein
MRVEDNANNVPGPAIKRSGDDGAGSFVWALAVGRHSEVASAGRGDRVCSWLGG